jgi:hypothetical protein
MRLLTAALCAGLLASALLSGLAVVGRRAAALALALAVTPTSIYLAGGVNPNGPEIAAAICVWLTLLLVVRSEPPVSSRVVVRAVVASGLLMTIRPLGLVLWLVIAGSMLVTAGVAPVRQLAEDARFRLAGVALALCAAAAGLLAIFEPPGLIAQPISGLSASEAVSGSFAHLPTTTEEMVGVFGWLDTHLPVFIPVAWGAISILVWAVALIAGSGRQRAGLVAVMVATVALPVALESARARSMGFYWQGRYSLPIAVGVPLLAVGVLAGRGLCRAHVDRLLVLGAAAGLVLAFVFVLNRYGAGHPSLSWDFRDGKWLPPAFSPEVIVATYAGAVLALAAWAVATVARSSPGVHLVGDVGDRHVPREVGGTDLDGDDG